ncbi:DUF6782 family putative metallopeptidase [Lactococcus garvieae]|uniref:DUF6782 domain-containing protein n=1 Tax=Lactococcus garvieae TaxID=1363 RepID=A0A1I4GI90_9LACT|nr:DUF6782 family putative metallopeptidase [Lactococcus garvieae]SFL29220.1 hypothetical protein SAMN05216438_10433 [Lactococcus garvieae]
MSNYKLTTIDQRFIAETIAATGSEQLLEKAGRNFVGLYDDTQNWYIPLRANISKKSPADSHFDTPFKTDNLHFRRPGLDFQKALYVPEEMIIPIKNTLPKEQAAFIEQSSEKVKEAFETYVLSLEDLSKESYAYQFSTVPLFPEGIEKIKALHQEKETSLILHQEADLDKLALIQLVKAKETNFTALSIAQNAHRMYDYMTELGVENPFAATQPMFEYVASHTSLSLDELEQLYMTQVSITPERLKEIRETPEVTSPQEKNTDRMEEKLLGSAEIQVENQASSSESESKKALKDEKSFNLEQITQEVFNQRTSGKEDLSDWKGFKTQDGKLDMDEAWQCFVQDVWDAKYNYVEADSPSFPDFEQAYNAYFYKKREETIAQDGFPAMQVEYQPAAIKQFEKMMDVHLGKSEPVKFGQEVDEKLVELARNKDLDALSKHMKEGLKNYLQGETYKKYLNFVSQFHRYSSHNIQMILAQNPKASLVAGAGTWKKNYGRFPSKGTKALWIYSAPRQYTVKDENGKPKLDKDGEEIKRSYYKLIPVYDVNQTTGKELPQLVEELQGQVKNYEQLFLAINQSVATPVRFGNTPGAARGYYDPNQNEIVLRSQMSEEQTIKTLIHEATHSELHTQSQARFGDEIYRRQEFEAESVAYVVTKHYGIDSSDYSFGYLANWGMNDLDLQALKATMIKVQEQSHSLIERIDQSLEKIQSKIVEKGSLDEEIERAKARQQQEPSKEVSSQSKKLEGLLTKS